MTDRRRFLMLPVVVGLACSKPGPQAPAVIKQFKLEGKIERIDLKRKAFVIEHGPILAPNGDVWMEAMTMEFPVKDEKALVEAKPGQGIAATVNQRESDYEYWISEIQLR